MNQIREGRKRQLFNRQYQRTISKYNKDQISAAFDAASEEYEGDSDEAMSDPEYLSLVLDNFDTSALEFMPGRDYLITNSTFIEGVYAALYYMIGFEE